MVGVQFQLKQNNSRLSSSSNPLRCVVIDYGETHKECVDVFRQSSAAELEVVRALHFFHHADFSAQIIGEALFLEGESQA